ncbi:MAG: hypothetical protein ACOYVD_17260 [Bacillota bacterium]
MTSAAINKARDRYVYSKAYSGSSSSTGADSSTKYHQHHSIPKEIQKKLPEDVRNHPDVKGRKGLPNRRPVEAERHLKEIHKGPGGGAYNKSFDQEILKSGGYSRIKVKVVTTIRDKLLKIFNIE